MSAFDEEAPLALTLVEVLTKDLNKGERIDVERRNFSRKVSRLIPVLRQLVDQAHGKPEMFNRVIDLVDDVRGCISKVKYGQWCEQLDVMYDDLIGIACAEADKAAHFHKEQVHKHGADTEFMYVDVNATASEGSSPSVLGKGRYGTLYKKLSKSDGCIYALKVIEISDPEWLARGRKECALLEKLKHVHIVRCFSGFPSSDNQRFLLVMELVEGGTLESVIGSTPSEAQIAQWIWQAASGLSYMHEKGVCHRDIKPSNLMLTAARNIKIIDLGVASDAGAEGRKTAGVGTSNYSSYEKSVGLPYDGKDDVWGLGCVLIELLTDRSLVGSIFDKDNAQIVTRRNNLLAECRERSLFLGDTVLSGMLDLSVDNRCTADEVEFLLTEAVLAETQERIMAAVRHSPRNPQRDSFRARSRIPTQLRQEMENLLGDRSIEEIKRDPVASERMDLLETVAHAINVTEDWSPHPVCLMPLLVEIGPPRLPSVIKDQPRPYQVNALHFICQACGERAPSGPAQKGYTLRASEGWFKNASAALTASVFALQMVKRVKSLDSKRVAEITKCFPVDIGNDVNEALKELSAVASETELTYREADPKWIRSDAAGNPELVIKTAHIKAVHALLLKAGDKVPPHHTGLKLVICDHDKKCAWVCAKCADSYKKSGGKDVYVRFCRG